MERAAGQNLLPQIEQHATALAEEAGFALLSPFADRHGVSELRLIRTHGPWTALVSLACDTTAKRAVRCELRASASSENNPGKQEDLGAFALASLDEAHSVRLSEALRRAFAQANELVASLAAEHPVLQMVVAQPPLSRTASMHRSA